MHNQPMSNKATITFYSKNDRSYTGREVAVDCKKGSTWKLTWDPLRLKVSEFLIMAETDPSLYNGGDVEVWIKEQRE